MKTPEERVWDAVKNIRAHFAALLDVARADGNAERETGARALLEDLDALRVRVGYEGERTEAAIEADRAQRAEPVDPDRQDDADMYRDAAAVDISWRAWDANGRQIGYSDAGINGAQAAAMFEAIERLEA